MALKEELKEFVTIFGQHRKNYGTVAFREEISSKTDALDVFYDTLIFDELLTVGGLMFINIETLEDLPNAQLNWYKIRDDKGNWVNDDQYWNKDWIVFANRNDDVLFYNRLDLAVYGSISKRETFKLGDSLEEFIKILHQCMKLQQEKYNMKAQDETEAPLPEFLDDIQTILDNNNKGKVNKEFMQFFFG
jgi:hypothetical protein